MTKGRRMNWLALALASLVLVAATGHFTAARVEAQQGPPTHQAILDSVGAVQTTVNSIETKVDDIKSKLDQIPPAWSQILPAADRFQLVMGGAAVLDKETGLVWEKSPETSPEPTTTQTWFNARGYCNQQQVGGRLGWRVPTIQELASLVDPTQFPLPLPAGHPFSNVQSSSVYWSANTTAENAGTAWVLSLIGGVTISFKDVNTLHVWCVRGGQGVDPQ